MCLLCVCAICVCVLCLVCSVNCVTQWAEVFELKCLLCLRNRSRAPSSTCHLPSDTFSLPLTLCRAPVAALSFPHCLCFYTTDVLPLSLCPCRSYYHSTFATLSLPLFLSFSAPLPLSFCTSGTATALPKPLSLVPLSLYLCRSYCSAVCALPSLLMALCLCRALLTLPLPLYLCRSPPFCCSAAFKHTSPDLWYASGSIQSTGWQ